MLNEIPVTASSEGDKTVLEVGADNMDFRSAEILKGILMEYVGQGHHHLVLNLSHVKFMDSSGLSVLLFGKRITEEVGGDFGICGLYGYVSNLIGSTNLNQTIKVYTNGLNED